VTRRVWGMSGAPVSMVASITLLVVLDGLGVADAAGSCSRRRAWGLLGDFVAAAIFVYDLGAHVWRGWANGQRATRGLGSYGGGIAFCNGVGDEEGGVAAVTR
jgi:hypothetical protein